MSRFFLSSFPVRDLGSEATTETNICWWWEHRTLLLLDLLLTELETRKQICFNFDIFELDTLILWQDHSLTIMRFNQWCGAVVVTFLVVVFRFFFEFLSVLRQVSTKAVKYCSEYSLPLIRFRLPLLFGTNTFKKSYFLWTRTFSSTKVYPPVAVMQSSIPKSSLTIRALGKRIVYPIWYWSENHRLHYYLHNILV